MSEKKYTFEVQRIGDAVTVLPPLEIHKAANIGESPVGIGEGKPRMSQTLVPSEVDSGYRHAPWGTRDDLPTQIRTAINRVPMAGTAIYRLVQMMYGDGIAYYRNSDLEQTNIIKRAYNAKVEQWLSASRVHTQYLPAQFADYRYYFNTFCELEFSRDRSLITRIFHKSAEHCRLSKQNPLNLAVEWLYYSMDYGLRSNPGDDKIKRIPLFRWYDEETFLNNLLGWKIAWHCLFPTPGSIYYARPFWLGLFKENGWMDVSASVPETVNSMMRNQITIKYLVNIPESYFEIRYGSQEWQSYSTEDRIRIMNELKDTLNNEITGTDGGPVSIMNFFRQQPVNGEAIGKIEIQAIDDKIKRDSWVPSANAADAQIVQGLGLHPSQLGLAPEGGKMGAGSGSDQRESFNAGITLNTIDQDIILEPLNWAMRYNYMKTGDEDWNITFFIQHTYHTTSNLVESGLSPDPNSLQVEDFDMKQ